MILLPRLHRHEVQLIHAALPDHVDNPEHVRGLAAEHGLRAHWNRSGGSPVSETQRAELREALEPLARRCGFPEPPDTAAQQAFDREACRIVHDWEVLWQAGGDTRRAACWAGLVCLDLLDLAVWRHGPKISAGRLHGRERNFLRRLWMRASVLRLRDEEAKDPWILVDRLTEDALVQVLERPSIAADRRLAQTVARTWLKKSSHASGMERIMRRAIKRIRAHAAVRHPAAIPDAELEALVHEAFEAAGRTEGETPVSPAVEEGERSKRARLSLPEAARRVLAESERRRWLSPKSRAALHALKTGESIIPRSERNALDYLLSRLAEAGLLADEVKVVRSVADTGSLSASEAAKPKKRSWAI